MSQVFRRWLVLGIVSMALLLIVIDMTVLYTALPTLTRELEASASMKLWIINAYTLVVASLLLSTGVLGDRWGYGRVFIGGLLIFGIASACAAFAPTAQALVAARVLLGVGAAMMMPATLAIIRITFLDERERSIAIGVWASVASGGAALGPVVGGVLLEHFWWGSVFLINVPVVVLAIGLTLGFIPKGRKPGQTQLLRWDYLSSAQALIAMSALVISIKEFAKLEPSLLLALITGLVAFMAMVLFWRRQRRSEAPLIDFRLFLNPGFSGGVIAAGVAAVALIGVELVFSQRLQLVAGLTPLEAGLAILPIPVAAFVAGPLAGLLLTRWASHSVILLGLIATAISLCALAMTLDVQGPVKLMVLTLLGLGVGVTITAASSAVMNNAPQKHAGMAASIEEVSYEFGGVLGIALLGSVLSWRYRDALVIPEGLTSAPSARDGIDYTLMAAERLEGAAAQQLTALAHGAFDAAFLAVMVTAVVLLVAAAVVVALLRSIRPRANGVTAAACSEAMAGPPDTPQPVEPPKRS